MTASKTLPAEKRLLEYLIGGDKSIDEAISLLHPEFVAEQCEGAICSLRDRGWIDCIGGPPVGETVLKIVPEQLPEIQAATSDASTTVAVDRNSIGRLDLCKRQILIALSQMEADGPVSASRLAKDQNIESKSERTIRRHLGQLKGLGHVIVVNDQGPKSGSFLTALGEAAAKFLTEF